MKQSLRVIIVCTLFALLLVFTYVDITAEHGASDTLPIYGVFEPYHAELMLFLAILGVVTGAMIYAFMGAKLERVKDQSHLNAELLLKLAEPTQRKILQYLIAHDGHAHQSELVRIEGLDKLKVHRAVKALKEKDVVQVEQVGKINKLALRIRDGGARL